jgi:hypothetical protein
MFPCRETGVEIVTLTGIDVQAMFAALFARFARPLIAAVGQSGLAGEGLFFRSTDLSNLSRECAGAEARARLALRRPAGR